MARQFPPPDGTQPEFRNDPAEDGFVHITPDGRIAWSAVAPDACNTCGGTGRWESTTEDAPTTLADLGSCPDCPTPEPWTFVVEVDGNGATFTDLGDSHAAVGLLIYTIATDREV